MIIGEGAARRFWPNQEAVGKYVLHTNSFGPNPAAATPLLVVGVAGDPKYGTLLESTTGLYMYRPLQQRYLAAMAER